LPRKGMLKTSKPAPRPNTLAAKKPARPIKSAANASKAKPRGRPRQSPAATQARRRQILKAALTVFSEHGFEAARLDEIARKAKVAKGTLYLYFPDKQAMFEALVRSAALPVLGDLSALSQNASLPADVLFKRMFDLFRREVLGTDRKLIMRLIISEGSRFPRIAAFYHREIISRIMAVLKAVARQAWQKGELATSGPVKHPQLIAAPLMLSVIWDGLFDRIAPLDVESLLNEHIALLTAKRKKR
jgi:AcrR family transcriptional regulator